jgi:type II secretory pathway predicted ATPase ExeA
MQNYGRLAVPTKRGNDEQDDEALHVLLTGDKRTNEVPQNLRFNRIDSRLVLRIRLSPKRGIQTVNKYS